MSSVNAAIYITEKNEREGDQKTEQKNEVKADQGYRYRGNQVEIERAVHTTAAADTRLLQPAAIIDFHLFGLYLI